MACDLDPNSRADRTFWRTLQVVEEDGERGRNRTFNLLIKSQLLCQLSYAPLLRDEKMLDAAAALIFDARLVGLAAVALRLLEDKGATADVFCLVQIGGLGLRCCFLCAHCSKLPV